MRKKIFVFLILLLASNDIAYGKHGNSTNSESNSTKHKKLHRKTGERSKRSANMNYFQRPADDGGASQKITDTVRDDAPFWGARGRRESSSYGNSEELQQMASEKHFPAHKPCFSFASSNNDRQPFWGNRGRRYDSNSDDRGGPWDNRVRRQEDEDPFWGSRGRRSEDDPFWGSRGRRSRNTLSDDDETPFWANRGRRGWSSLHDEPEPFWGNRGKPISDVDNESDVKVSPLKSPSFWSNRGRDSAMKYLFNGVGNREKPRAPSKEVSVGFHVKPPEQNTIKDNRMYAEEPRYILIERSSRSSMEDDPYIITRGKKYSNRLAKAARGRRGALEDIVKSVQKDPYYIARGKKSSFIKVGNTLMALDNLNRDKLCGIVQSLRTATTVKREINDPERDRRAILKKLAAKLQEDPYFVSRGKKNTPHDDRGMYGFVAAIAEMCS